ncbi:hypothetical protein XAP412_270152 [Xanthomonas phaseoli pv. phaseoli]|uniref:Uncharacterized protein n=1 Tax=Xanthomonas campestris pv. phaseoli TaxID=317013 RepID=A0AB38DZR6_XANCH|nr:hypothetical protein XAP6984_330151 [Xanthomonas phaseoli pv. phaseoli]SON83087.1 hypothetical protein XAP412_270152 [Xanthomonas phaseoli pv. phaseoli]SON87265.1 hypothetical protein XAP7430_280151 [Xanthomonas phaseoli pv. phaseoli]SOO27219.1 hypothetical protein XAP6164_1400001 [Xanthomonas phaseoli pv. phaseoli]
MEDCNQEWRAAVDAPGDRLAALRQARC